MDDSFEESQDLYALGGDDRIFALALIHSDHTDDELELAMKRGRDAGYPAGSVLGRYACGPDALTWNAALRAALHARREG